MPFGRKSARPMSRPVNSEFSLPEAKPMNTQFGPFSVGGQQFGGPSPSPTPMSSPAGGINNIIPQSPDTPAGINPNEGIQTSTPITNTPSTTNYNAGSFFNMPKIDPGIQSMIQQWLSRIMQGGTPGRMGMN